MFLRNCWYVAAMNDEVHRLLLMRRVILGEPVLLYRKSDGTPVALEDRCPHRHAPLSMGRLVRGDLVECAYHGLTFDGAGKCVRIPAQDTIPPSANVRSYPVVERHHWIWIWMGDPALADPATIEDFHWIDDPNWRAKGERLHVEGNYMLVVENLVDLSHLPFVHRTSLADTAIPINEIPIKTERDGNRVRVNRWVLNTSVPPYFKLFRRFPKEARADRWMNLEFSPPAMVRIDIGAAPAGTGAYKGKRVDALNTWNLNAITPETETSCHYFWAQAQDFGLHDPSITDLDFQMVHGAFLEDLKMIKGQQENIQLNPKAPRLNIATDSGGLLAKRIVDQLIEQERAQTKAA